MNILISCSGKQVNLVQWFKKSVGDDSIVVATDLNPYAPSLAVADLGLVSPPISSSSYKEWILNICKDHSIGLLLSLYEEDLVVLENLRDCLQSIGSILVGADPLIVNSLTNKWLVKPFLESAGLLYPPTKLLNDFDGSSLKAPYIIKPCKGRGSRGITRLNSAKEVSHFSSQVKNPSSFIVQQIVPGEEYCFDVVNNLERQYQCSLIRKRIRMGEQETDVAVTTRHSGIEIVAKKLSLLSKHQGAIDVEAIENDRGIFIVDINMRFGGSYSFSHAAGANLPSAIVAWAKGQNPPDESLVHIDGLISAKFNSVYRLSQSNLLF